MEVCNLRIESNVSGNLSVGRCRLWRWWASRFGDARAQVWSCAHSARVRLMSAAKVERTALSGTGLASSDGYWWLLVVYVSRSHSLISHCLIWLAKGVEHFFMASEGAHARDCEWRTRPKMLPWGSEKWIWSSYLRVSYRGFESWNCCLHEVSE